MQARNILTNLCPIPSRSEKPGLTYNSAPCQKFHSKTSTVLAYSGVASQKIWEEPKCLILGE